MYRGLFFVFILSFVGLVFYKSLYPATNVLSQKNYSITDSIYCANAYVAASYNKPQTYIDPSNIKYLTVDFDAKTFFAVEESKESQPASTLNRIGRIYSYEELQNFDFLYSNFFVVESITSLEPERYNTKKYLEMDLSLEKKEEPQILIFHTHSKETFIDSNPDDPDTTIVGVGAELKKHLEALGYKVIHDTNSYDVYDRSKAYTYSNEAVKAHLEKYPSIEVVLDVHRDGVPDDLHLACEYNGKKMAQVMLFNGISYTKLNGKIDYLENVNLDTNLATSLQMQLLANAYFPNLMRKMYIDAYRYCLHHRGRSMLVEVGAQSNTIEEAKNAMEPFAITLDKLLKGEKIIE